MPATTVSARMIVFLVIAALGGPARVFGEDLVAETTDAAAADPDFALQGEYTGDNVGVQVVALGGGEFQVVRLGGGLPGEGWNGKDRQVIEDDAAAVRDLIESQKLKRVERKSPTLDLPPPPGAVVLFDGKQPSLDEHWHGGAKMTPDGLLMQGATSKDTFTDYTLHLEFRLPYMPAARGQGRGNSGVYYQGRYETQVLDSFGLEGKNNECGGLYSIRDPDTNMCLPPLAWQTYDCDYTAPRWNAEGQKIADARITVRLNGVVIHQDVPLPGPTTAAPFAESADPGPVFLQDHGNPVRFRNIWVLPRNAELEALRPVVPVFERFHAGTSGTAAVAGGRLLITELGCTNCHAADEPSGAALDRSGPILDGVGQRAHAAWLAKFLESPHHTKPGTTMPAMFDGLSDAQRQREVQAIVSFLVGSESPVERHGDRAAAQRGAQLYREIGCVACHAPRDGAGETDNRVSRSSTIPLPDLTAKYTVPSLTAFLKNPHAVRPSGRMPGFGFEDREAREIACYLIGDSGALRDPNVAFAVYDTNGDDFPDFAKEQPVDQGLARGFDVSVAGKENNYALRFTGFWKVEKTGQYRFFLGSDDGSRLLVDGEELIDNGGIHPHQDKVGRSQITAGIHEIQVDYFQGGGEASLTVEIDGSGLPRQPLELLLHPTREAAELPAPAVVVEEGGFVVDPALREEGRELFVSRGCAACHRLTENGQPLVSKRAAKPLKDVGVGKGCLAAPGDSAATGSEPAAPRYDLSPAQHSAVVAALAALHAPADEASTDRIATTMASFNCYACHKRDGIGGPERDRDPLFLTSIHEMGDEGRIPPPLDGVGDKLREDWLRHVLTEGAKDRPYMKTRMPKFGALPVDQLTKAFVAEQKNSGQSPPPFDEAPHRVKATGRKLAGNNGLACVKCHTFGKYPASGIQAIDLQTLTRRVREDWFYRYLVDPQVYRRGTRMPTAFVDGKSTLRDIYDGDPARQMAAVWTYLLDGDKAAVPEGVLGETIELTPTDSPILYRNFLTGLSPRGIAVGYPEKAHLAWDAEQMCLALVWHGRFMDAGRHWTGRGEGRQSPLGDHVMRIDESAPIAVLTSRDTDWPEKSPRENGYAFRGYRLDAKQRPTFRYDLLQPGSAASGDPLLQVAETPIPVTASGQSDAGFERTLVLTAATPVENLYFRAARADRIDPAPDDPTAWIINGEWRVKLRATPSADPFLRESRGQKELIVPLRFEDGRAEVVELLHW